LETSRNILILKDLVMYLQDKKSKLTLYTYDAMLIDFDKRDGKVTLQDIDKILSQDGKYPTRIKYGTSMNLE